MEIKVNDFTYRTWYTLVHKYGYERRKAVEWILYNGALNVERNFNVAKDIRDIVGKERETVYVKRNVEDVYAVKQEEESKSGRERIPIGRIPESSLRVNLRSTKYIKFNNKDSREIMDMNLTHFYVFVANDKSMKITLANEKSAGSSARRISFQKNGGNVYATLPVCKSCNTFKVLKTVGIEDGMCVDLQFTISDTGEYRVIRVSGTPLRQQREIDFNNN